MRIVIFTPYWLQTKGGITTVAKSLAKNLQKQENFVYILTPDDGGGAIKLPKNKILFVLGAIWNFIKIKPEIIHIHASGFLIFPSIIYKTFFNKKTKIIFTFHTQPEINLKTSNIRRECGRLKKIFFEFFLKKCNAVTYVSNSILKSLQNVNIKIDNPIVIYNGTQKEDFDTKETGDFKNKYNLAGAHPILCMIGVFSWDWKIEGMKILISAFRKTISLYPNAKLLIIGEGKYRKALEEFINKMKMEGRVILVGKVDNSFAAISACDIYCHISLNESFGLAVLEAMVSGKPVIASREGGIPEIVTNNFDGILVESNPRSVSTEILRLLNDAGLRSALAEKALLTAESKFSWTKITEEYLKLYKKLL